MLGRTDSRRRLLFLLVTFAVVGAALVTRLAYWQVGQRDRLAEAALAQTTMRIDSPSRRGDIYDRSGVVVLATTVERERLAATPSQLSPTRRSEVAAALVGLLGLKGDDATTLTDRMTSDKQYVVLAHGLDTATADRIRAATTAPIAADPAASDPIAADPAASDPAASDPAASAAAGSGSPPATSKPAVEGILLEPEPVRVYPHEGGGPGTTLAAQVLGFVNRDGVGQYGVEQYYQDLLNGKPRIIHAQRDISARAIPDTVVVDDPGTAGVDLRLTIDAGLQLALEQELLAAWAADQAKSVSAVVMDPYTGEILAEASYPSYDGNDYRAIASSDPNRFIDPVVSSVYEPGSVFKMLTAIAGLETKTVTTTTELKDVAKLVLDGGRTHVDDADHKGKGWMKFEDAIAWSRNVVAAKVALGLGATTRESSAILHEVWTRLGFGSPTGVDLANEVGGILHDPTIAPWRQIDLANGAFGQGVAVTPLQLATAYAAMMNGGTLVTPHVVSAIGSQQHVVASRGQVIDPAMSPTLIAMMNHVVSTVPFYRDRTLIKGYDVGGKTGTAQIWDSTKHAWKHNLFNYSFIGYIARQPGIPDLVVAVKIDEGRPTIARIGQLEMPVMSFELFRRIAYDAITRPGILPEKRAPIDGTVASR
jgi:cell division protein FtsI (penicillin-binding protein 3)